MSLFQRMMASIGIGSAKVDTLLEKQRVEPGETVRGVVRVKGGSIDQQVDTIYIKVMTQYIREINDRKVYENAELAQVRVSDPFTIGAGKTMEIPFAFELPWFTPITIGRTPVWMKTVLDVKGGMDPTDDDRVEVVPNAAMRAVMNGVSELGFRLQSADCEYAPRIGYGRIPFVQELEYIPVSGPYRGRLDELEVTMMPQGSQIDLLLQIDRRARGLAGLFAEAMDMDETFVRCTLDASVLSAGPRAVARELDALIHRFS